MEKFKNVVIGFGKAGKTLAKFLAQHDEEVLLIERSIRCMAAPASTLAVCRLKI
jgi:pyruvate/2-oxoglutarate dehydrogenase complex dihydrolipoamide dehydrogenase (E3) component